MALGTGQLSLADIAGEYGGSAPHALSEYYDDGNAPGSGEIQLHADFQGTSAGIACSFMVLAGGGGGGAYAMAGGAGAGGYEKADRLFIGRAYGICDHGHICG